ncbi:MAG: dephospho-CoA kinase [Alistipes sp.]|nr:dephospho-CoA kinase [Alistipes sp.]
MIKVGICGGIGGGKSTVCALLAEKGVPVYDSDSRAKALMNTSPEIVDAVKAAFGGQSYRDGMLDRAYLAAKVFGDEEALARLDAIVHPAVRRDFEEWAAEQQADYVVLESAILFESGFDACVDASVAVLAPHPLRLERAMQRDGAVRERILERMAAQMSDDELAGRADLSIVNIDREDLEHDVAELDRRLRSMARRKNSAND